jgi:spore germination protein GerM
MSPSELPGVASVDSAGSGVLFDSGIPELTPEAIAAADREFPLVPSAPEGTFASPGIEDSDAAGSANASPSVGAPTAQGASSFATGQARTLYFASVDDTTGMIFIKTVKRRLNEKSSPLIDSINALLTGPSGEDKRAGFRSLIPEGSQLLSARVEGSTAYLNFNEAFMFNGFGAEGYVAQLRQVVWTATEFATVQDVQISIEGKILNFFDTKSVKTPLNRNSY